MEEIYFQKLSTFSKKSIQVKNRKKRLISKKERWIISSLQKLFHHLKINPGNNKLDRLNSHL